MNKVDSLIENISKYAYDIQKDDLDIIQDFEGSQFLPDAIERYEAAMAKVFRDELNRLVALLNSSIAKAEDEIIFDSLTFEQMLQYYENDLFISEEFKEATKDINAGYFREIVENIASSVMDSIDPDIPFEETSRQTSQIIEEWSEELADIMQLNTNEHVENVLTEAFEEGKSIQNVELELKDMPDFDRQRARTTAITEMVSASNVALQESYNQSPAVRGKKWRHSGAKNRRQPRPNHMLLDGKIIDKDKEFSIPGSSETCMQPGDPKLSPGERIHCGCISSPVVDENILGLSYEEKMDIRAQAREELGLT